MSRGPIFTKTRGRQLLLSLLAATTHAELAGRVGIPRSTITAYADGSRMPSLAHALDLRDRAGIAVDSWRQEASETVRLVASPAVILTESLPAAANEGRPS